MIRKMLCLLLLLVVLPLEATEAPPNRGEARFHSSILDEDRGYRVIVPDSYGSAISRTYPVLYLLDGQTHGAHTAASLGFLMQQGEIPEIIIVAIDSTVRVRDFTQTDWPSHWIGGGGADRFADFLQSELIPRIERDYRTQPFRILSGHSASGQFALHMLATRPAVFNAVLAMAPSLDWDDRLPIRELETGLGAKNRPMPRFVYFAYGDDHKAALDDDLRLERALKAPGDTVLRAVVNGFPNERHGSLPLLAQIDGMRRLYEGYAMAESDRIPSLAQVQAHYDALGSRLGIAMPIPETTLNDLGYRYLESGDSAQAIALLARAARENPESANAWDSLADAHASANQWQQALASELKALDLAKRFGAGDTTRYQHQVETYRAKLAPP